MFASGQSVTPAPPQVGVIRPVARDMPDSAPKVKKVLAENKTKTNSVLVSNLNKVNNNRTEENRDPRKEVIVIDKEVLVPVDPWTSQGQVPHIQPCLTITSPKIPNPLTAPDCPTLPMTTPDCS